MHPGRPYATADRLLMMDATANQPTADELITSLAEPSVRADPYPVYARLRQLAPVHRAASGAVFLSGYEDCATLTRGPAFRSQGPEFMDAVAPGWRKRPGRVATVESLLFRDPPDHTRLRRLVSGAFTPRRTEALREEVVRLVDDALDAIAEAGSDGGVVNLHEILSGTLPISVIGALVGVPPEDWPLLRGWMTAMMQIVEMTTNTRIMDEADEGARRLTEYFADLVAQRRAHPREDLATALVTVRDSGDSGDSDSAAASDPSVHLSETAVRLSETELLQTLILLFMAGVDTMVNHLAAGTAALLAHPDQLDALRTDPALAPSAVEEMLRYDAPIQIVGRVTGEPVRLGEVDIPAGALVIGLLGAANRDPSRFPDPDVFDIARRPGISMLSFGGGMHYCLGAPLARIESAQFFPAFLARFPTLALGGEPVRRGLVLRGFATLPITVS
jgi:cytochrome P450